MSKERKERKIPGALIIDRKANQSIIVKNWNLNLELISIGKTRVTLKISSPDQLPQLLGGNLRIKEVGEDYCKFTLPLEKIVQLQRGNTQISMLVSQGGGQEVKFHMKAPWEIRIIRKELLDRT